MTYQSLVELKRFFFEFLFILIKNYNIILLWSNMIVSSFNTKNYNYMFLKIKYFKVLLVVILNLFCSLYVTTLFAFPEKSSFVILDYNSGKILSEENSNYRIQPASLTKLMTLSILFEKLEQNKISFSTKIRVSKYASNQPPSKLWIKPGTTISVRDAINAMIVKSANDAAYAVGEFLGNGNLNNFIKIMNKKVKKLGLQNTNFATPNGLTAPNQYTTSYDMAILARYIMQKYSKYYYLFSQKNFVWNHYNYPSTNHLLNYSNVDGLKTGFTKVAGYNMVVSAQINGVRVIVASLGNNSIDSRDNLVKHLVTDGIVVASNFLFSQINYKSPPDKVLEANNVVNNNLPSNFGNFISGVLKDNNTDTNIQTVNYTPNSKNPLYIDVVNPYEHDNNSTYTKTKTIKKSSKKTKFQKNNYIQIGVFSEISTATRILKKATSLKEELKKSNSVIQTIKNKNNKNLYQVRIYNIDKNLANQSCSILKKNKVDCIYVAYK